MWFANEKNRTVPVREKKLSTHKRTRFLKNARVPVRKISDFEHCEKFVFRDRLLNPANDYLYKWRHFILFFSTRIFFFSVRAE